VTVTRGDALSDIQRGIAALEAPSDLLRSLDGMADLAAARDDAAVRYGVARGVVLNRLGLPGSALTELHRARRLAGDTGDRSRLAEISREIGRVHAWRGETASAALELCRSMVEADAAGSAVDRAAVVAECGRLNLETGRYEAALAAFDSAAAVADQLSDREVVRLPVNRCEALAALGQTEDCLAEVEQRIAATPEAFRLWLMSQVKGETL